MSSDLISRQALIRSIVKEYDTQFGQYSLMEMIDEVQKEPTAYDVDKVIEQLQKAKTRMSCYRLNNIADDRISIDEAIEIVRKGGIEK
ncbi:hypothetical protein BLAHAN_05465 [Blautia hansenii DSM 20583]|uniref:Uncharacterized protein n=2 Tax=Blautia hansenii TaxID=1322 RepID=C9L7U5_BLAHA|nr:hypothetical protein [Blautia hansenii]ASM69750.1 hypothetical protein CGC63_09395 [Blautia hansenii DSM 20583]EEX21840.1 hypothetical protein BLAHAN_05465 [Blautia hansenii DSM 20583]